MNIRMSEIGNTLSFPDYEQGSRLGDLAHAIAGALGATARPPAGSPFERLIRFAGYPDAFALWWDGFTCELGCSDGDAVDMAAIAERLIASGSFSRS